MLRADCALFIKPNIPLAVVEAKDSQHTKGVEMVHALGRTSVEAIDLAIHRTTKQVHKRHEIHLSLYRRRHEPQAGAGAARRGGRGRNAAERKAMLFHELEQRGVFLDALADAVANSGSKDLDPFDLLLHVACGQPTLTRRERAQRVKKRNVFTRYGPVARQVLEALLDKCADEGITTVESDAMLRLQPLAGLGSPADAPYASSAN